MGSEATQPLVSVIIACKNTAEYFRACLLSIEHQTYKNIEVIVVDNFSTDGTYEIAKKYADQVYQIGPERSTQFNFGFDKSNGEYIYRIGPDYVLEADVIEKCVKKIQEGFDALALHNRSKGSSIWAKVRYYERESYRNDKTIVAVRFMKRQVFEDLGMFDESLVAGEDFDLHNRMEAAGYKWSHVDAIENHIGEPKNIHDVWNKFYYYGRTIKRYQNKNKSIAGKQLKFFRGSFLKVQGDLLKRPHLFITFWLYMFVKYAAGFFGLLAGAPMDLPSKQHKHQSKLGREPLVSVVIPTKNSAKNIDALLESFEASVYKNYEIIVNDDVASTDNIVDVITKRNKKLHNRVQYFKENISMAQGRFVGAEKAAGKYLLHLDSDMQISPYTLNECIELVEGNQCDIVVIPEHSIGSSFWAKVKALEKAMYQGVEQLETARFMRRSDYIAIGGHDKSLVFSEDKDLDIRLKEFGLKRGYATSYLVHDEGSIKLMNTLKKKLGYSATSSLFAQKHPKAYKWQANIFARYWIYFRNIKYMLRSPIKYIALLVLKALEYIFSFVGVMRQKLLRNNKIPNLSELLKDQSKKRIVIATHSTKLHGPVDSVEEFMVHEGHTVFKIVHPLLDYNSMNSAVMANLNVVFEKKRNPANILNLILDFLFTLRTTLKLRPQVYIGANNFDTLPGIFARKIFRVKIDQVIYFGTDFSENKYSSKILNNIYYAVERVAIKYADKVISNTDRAFKKRTEFGLQKSKSLVLPNGVQLSNPDFTSKVIDRTKFIFVGAVTKEHGLYETIAFLDKHIKSLVIIGGGEDLDRVVGLCDTLSIPLELYVNQSHDFTVEYLQKFDGLGLAPYNNDSLWTYYCSPLKVAEYISCGVPVVMSAMPEIAKLVQDESLGVVFDGTTDSKALIKKINNINLEMFNQKSESFYERFESKKLMKKILA